MNILIVEDHVATLESIKLALELEYRENIITAENVTKAILSLRNCKFDVVILDYYLDMEVSTKLAAIVRKSCPSHTKIILISAHPKINEIKNTIDHDYLLKKPFDLESLYVLFNKIQVDLASPLQYKAART